MIKNVIFDIGMVLLTFNWDEYVHSLFNDEETEKAVTAATWHNPKIWNELDKGVMTAEEVCRLFEQSGKGYEKQIRLAFDRMGECPVQQPYAIPWIKELKAKGLKVYYLSNYSYYLMDACPEALSFREHMDGGVFSCEEKLTKPDPEIYRRLCEKYGLVPSECLFIDDLAANVEGAQNVGLNAVRFESYEKNYTEIMGDNFREMKKRLVSGRYKPFLEYKLFKYLYLTKNQNSFSAAENCKDKIFNIVKSSR